MFYVKKKESKNKSKLKFFSVSVYIDKRIFSNDKL